MDCWPPRATLPRREYSQSKPGQQRLLELLTNQDPKRQEFRRDFVQQLLAARPEALVEGVAILNAHRDEVVQIMTRYGYTDPMRVGGYLDRDLPDVRPE